MAEFPSGTVTFLFTDVEGSTRLWAEDHDGMSASLERHDAILREAIESRDGYVFTTAGDSFAAAFARATDAVDAAQAAQRQFATVSWPGPPLRVRMGLHLGEADERDGDYFGSPVNTAARVEAAAHGGQILLTEAVRAVAGVEATELGVYALRNVAEPIRLVQIGDREFPPLRVADPNSSNLPVRPTRLVGRDDEVRRARELLLDHRLLTVAAVGGSGKTRLALAVGEEELHHRSGGVWFVDLRTIVEPDDVPSTVAEAVGLAVSAGDATDQVIRFLAPKDALVILDNCENVIDGVAAFAERFLRAAGSTSLLATSREALDVEGEVVAGLSSLDSGGADSPGVKLFLDRALAVYPGFDTSAPNLEVVSRICTRLDGMPLAIELAAARVTVLTAGELLAGLSDRFQLLSGGRRRQRQRTLEATLDWSYDLLDPEEQRVFRALGVFVDGFDLDAVAAVVGVPRGGASDVVEALVAKSLVIRADLDSGARFGLLETLKAYAEDRLLAADEGRTVRTRHLEHFAARAQLDSQTWLAEVRVAIGLRHDVSNLTAAVDWALASGRWKTAADLLVAAEPSYSLFGRPSELLGLIERALATMTDVDPGLTSELKMVQVGPLIVLDDFVRVLQVAALLGGSASPLLQAMAAAVSGWVLLLASPRSGSELLRRADELITGADHGAPGRELDSAKVWLWFAEASSLGYQGDIAGAREKARACVGLEKVNDHLTSVGTLIGGVPVLATCEILLGRPDRALDLLEANRGLGHGLLQFSNGEELRPLALLAVGDVEPAVEEIRAYARRSREGRFSREANDAVLLLAALAMHEGDTQVAADLLMHMGIGRQPATIMAAFELARRLDIEDVHAEYVRSTVSTPGGDLGSDDADGAVLGELERRNWL